MYHVAKFGPLCQTLFKANVLIGRLRKEYNTFRSYSVFAYSRGGRNNTGGFHYFTIICINRNSIFKGGTKNGNWSDECHSD